MQTTNPFEALGLSANATAPDVKAAFRRRSLATHPDRNPAADGTAFRAAREAYEALRTPARLDAARRRWSTARSAPRRTSSKSNYAAAFWPGLPDPALGGPRVPVPDETEFPPARRSAPSPGGRPGPYLPPPGWRPGKRPPYAGICIALASVDGPGLWIVASAEGMPFVFGPDPAALAWPDPADPKPRVTDPESARDRTFLHRHAVNVP